MGMLVLSRRIGERIIINQGPDEIIVTLVDTEKGRAKLGIDAPRDMVVVREELIGNGKDQLKGNDNAKADR